jgi:hypothetical protein
VTSRYGNGGHPQMIAVSAFSPGIRPKHGGLRDFASRARADDPGQVRARTTHNSYAIHPAPPGLRGKRVQLHSLPARVFQNGRRSAGVSLRRRMRRAVRSPRLFHLRLLALHPPPTSLSIMKRRKRVDTLGGGSAEQMQHWRH